MVAARVSLLQFAVCGRARVAVLSSGKGSGGLRGLHSLPMTYDPTHTRPQSAHWGFRFPHVGEHRGCIRARRAHFDVGCAWGGGRWLGRTGRSTWSRGYQAPSLLPETVQLRLGDGRLRTGGAARSGSPSAIRQNEDSGPAGDLRRHAKNLRTIRRP